MASATRPGRSIDRPSRSINRRGRMLAVVALAALFVASSVSLDLEASASTAASSPCCRQDQANHPDLSLEISGPRVSPSTSNFTLGIGGWDPGAGAVPLTVRFFEYAEGGVPPYHYAWAFGDNNSSQSNTTGNTTHVYTSAGTFNATLVVNDSANDSVNQTDKIIVEATPMAISPINATPSPTLDVGQSVTFRTNISGAGGFYNISWLALPSGCTSANATLLVCHPNATGSWAVTVCARDPEYVSTCAPWLGVVVGEPPQVQKITTTPNQLDANQSLRLSLIVTGYGYGNLSYDWSNLPPGCESAQSTTIVCTPTAPGTYHVRATATDSNLASSSVEVTVVIHPDPTVIDIKATPPRLDLGSSVVLVANVSGGLGNFSYHWMGLPSGCSSSNTSTLLCAPTAPCTCNVSLVATDPSGLAATGATSIDLGVGSTFGATTRIAPPSVTVGSPFWVNTTVRGGVGPFSYAYFGLPSDCVASNTSSLRCSPNATGTFDIEVEAQDDAGAHVFAGTNVTVNSSPSSTSGFSWTGTDGYLVIGLGAVVVMGVAVLVIRRPKRPPA